MSSQDSSPRQHARTEPAAPQPEEPSHAERIRTLAATGSVAVLSTMSRKHAGFPFGSLMPYALDATGRPIFLISNMAMHTQNLRSEPRASLFLTKMASKDDPLGSARATLVGLVHFVPELEIPEARALYLAQHESSRYWVDFADFHFFRLQPVEIYYVGGFGVMGWVNAEDYETAAPDPLSAAAAGILEHMNADHVAAMVSLAGAQAGIHATEAAMTSVDRLGFTLRLTTGEGMKGIRINFPREARTAQEVRSVLVAMLHALEPH